MEEQRLIVTASPHIRDSASNRSLMGNVVIALIPTVCWHRRFIFGAQRAGSGGRRDHRSLCGALNIFMTLLMHKRQSRWGIFPPWSPASSWHSICRWGCPCGSALVGAFVAIVIVKQMFGGLGYNVANPALVGRIVLFLELYLPHDRLRLPRSSRWMPWPAATPLSSSGRPVHRQPDRSVPRSARRHAG